LAIIGEMFFGIEKTVEQVNESRIRFDHSMQTISETIENLSGSTEQLSAGTEEMAATADVLDDSAAKMQQKAHFVQTNVMEEYGNVIEYGDDFAKDANTFKDFAENISSESTGLSLSL
jgi:methyl-accepting chemotaxis protein